MIKSIEIQRPFPLGHGGRLACGSVLKIRNCLLLFSHISFVCLSICMSFVTISIICSSVCLSVCLPACLPACLCPFMIYMSVCLYFVCLLVILLSFFCLSVFLHFHLFTHSSIHPFVHSSIHPLMHLCLSINLCITLTNCVYD